MKTYYLIILLALVVYINNKCSAETGSTVKECNNKEFSGVEELAHYKYCCLLSAHNVNDDAKICVGLNQTQYDNIKDTISYYKSKTSATSVNIDCKSNYLEIGLLFLFLLFI